MAAFVGRAHELADIEQALADARAGSGRLVLVSGPAGIGKSRLADAARAGAAGIGMAVAAGYAVADPGAPSLWPWRRALRPLAADEVAGAITSALRTEDGEPDAAARFELFVSLTDVLRRCAEPTGLLVVLEDLHWADRLSVRFLRHVAAELPMLPAVLLVTVRDAVAGAMFDALPELSRGDAVRPVALRALTRADVAEWLPALTGSADDQLASALHEHTGGNPLLVRLVAGELARTARDRRQLPDLRAFLAERPHLRRLVAARVDELGAEVRTVLDAASILGERVAVDVVAAMTGLRDDDVRAAVHAAVSAGVLRTDETSVRPRFEHALVRDAVYAQLPDDRRAALHRAAAEALARLAPDELAGVVAHHWQRASGADAPARCAHWAVRADDQARATLAYDDAVRFAELAVAAVRPGPAVAVGERAELLVRLAEARYLANDVPGSVATCVAAADLAVAAGRPDLQARAALVVHGVGAPGVVRTIAGLCEQALARVPTGDHVTRARLQAQIAVGVVATEGGPRAAERAATALAEAERSGDPGAILEALDARHQAISYPQAVGERRVLAARAIEFGRSARAPIAALWGHLWAADAAIQLGDLATADQQIDEIARVADEHRWALARWHHHRFGALRSALVGNFAGARAENDRARVIAERIGDPPMMAMHVAFQVHLAMARGAAEEVPGSLDVAMDRLPPIALVRVSRPLMSAIAGRRDDARAEFEQYRDLAPQLPLGPRWFPTIVQIGYVATLLPDPEVCAQIYELLVPVGHYYAGDGSGAVFSHGANARLLGDLAHQAGRYEVAAGHHRDAIGANARIGARPFAALARLGCARALVAGGRSADLREAAQFAAAAAAEFRRLDMPAARAEAAALLDRVGAARRNASPLTDREAEVAGLVADALSNRQIAQRLVLSERTVETHVRNILTKLGFSTRTEIATWALRDVDAPREGSARG